MGRWYLRHFTWRRKHTYQGDKADRIALRCLTRTGYRDDGWTIDLEDPKTGDKWVLDHPGTDLHGKRPARLRRAT